MMKNVPGILVVFAVMLFVAMPVGILLAPGIAGMGIACVFAAVATAIVLRHHNQPERRRKTLIDHVESVIVFAAIAFGFVGLPVSAFVAWLRDDSHFLPLAFIITGGIMACLCGLWAWTAWSDRRPSPREPRPTRE